MFRSSCQVLLRRFFGESLISGPICRLSLVVGVALLAAGAVRLATPSDDAELRRTEAKAWLDGMARSLLVDISGVVQPTISRTEEVAADPGVANAIAAAGGPASIDFCNEAVTKSKEIDALALFDRQGNILAINTKFASGQTIAPWRIERVLQKKFDNRPIIQQCVHNAGQRRLEFQTDCDITPAFFDSSGLSIAYSAPVTDRSGAKLGVVSSRLRFERIAGLIRTKEAEGGIQSVNFISDKGEYFSEEINSGRVLQPIPRSELAELVTPLVAGAEESVIARRDSSYLLLYRLKDFATITGHGIQVMIVADESWFAKELSQSRQLAALGYATAGLALILLGGLVGSFASLRRSAQSSATLAAVVENSCEAVICETPDGRITTWNKAAEQIFGYAAAEAAGRTVLFLLDPEQVEHFRQTREQVRRGIACPPFETTMIHREGRRLDVSLSVSPIKDHAGRVIGISKIVHDISARKRMEKELAARDEQLRQSHKLEAVGSLAGGIAHEFNNLLQVVRGYGEYAMEGLAPDDARYQDLQQVLKAADRATTLTRQLLGFSRRQTLERETFAHQEVVTDLVRLLRPIIGEHIELDIKLDPTEEPLHADRTLLQQMLLNLCINARDAMPGGGRLTISTKQVDVNQTYCDLHAGLKPGRYLTFSVADTGCGMRPEIKEHIFEPFFTTKGVGRGTGLGLAMVYGCVQQHGGIINVYSEVGLGTTFKIYLPLANASAAAAHEPSPLEVRGGHETILVAEDEELVRALTVRVLKRAGYTVLEAANGLQAVEVFRAHADEIALALLDAVMPKKTGLQAFEQIKAARPDLPVIFCSGYDPETGQVQSLVDQGQAIIQKPYDPDHLIEAVREALDRAAFSDAARDLCEDDVLEGATA